MELKELLTDLSSYFQDYPLHNQFNQGQSKVANGIFPTNLDATPENTYGKDLRPNHVPIEQHSIFLEQLCNWIDNNKKIDFTVFK